MNGTQMNIASIFDLDTSTFFKIEGMVPCPVHLKCETFNVAGSIKIKPALEMITALETAGTLLPGGRIVESSSGNLGIALSVIAAAKGYGFTCVTDPNVSSDAVRHMRALGASVIVVDQPDENGGYLATRLKLIAEMCRADKGLVWVNQYANSNNWGAHYRTTALEILAKFPRIDHLFIGTGTGGTLMGCARYFREHSPTTKITAVDAEGSVTFGGAGKSRKIPGLGTSRKPEIVDASVVNQILYVSEADTVKMCREIARAGLLAGGSTGTVLSGVRSCAATFSEDDVVVTIMPDLGNKYLDTIYDDAWLTKNGFIQDEPQQIA